MSSDLQQYTLDGLEMAVLGSESRSTINTLDGLEMAVLGSEFRSTIKHTGWFRNDSVGQ